MEGDKTKVNKLWEIEEFTECWEDEADDFEQMGLKETLLRGIFGYGFEKPSAIQRRAIVPMTKGKDLIGQAQSGTGKTASYLVGLLQNVDPGLLKIQALVLVPTRELAENVKGVLKGLSNYMELKIHACIGGISASDQTKILTEGVQIVVGTPGRVADFAQRSILDTKHLKTLVIDEADELFSRGFIDNIRTIASMLPPTCQICLFSATLPQECLQFAQLIMQNPVRIIVRRSERTLQGARQYFLICKDEVDKEQYLLELLKCIDFTQCMIYANSGDKCSKLADKLRDEQFPSLAIYPKQSREQNKKNLMEFRTGSCRLLFGTDVFNSEIQSNPVSLTINFELPLRKEDYVERVGHSGCYGRRSTVINFVSGLETKILGELQTYYSTNMDELPTDLGEIGL